MFIKYNGTNCHAIPYLNYVEKRFKNKKTGKVAVRKVLETTQSPQDVHVLRPGWNEFPKHIWDQNASNPAIQKMLKKGTIELMNEKVTISKGGKKTTKAVGQEDGEVRLRWFEVKRAVQIAKATYNRDMLQRWLDEETRSPVKRALEKQLKPLLNTESEETSAADDDDETAVE